MFAVGMVGNHLSSPWLIPTGATVHSHCEMDLIAQMRFGGRRGGGVQKTDAIGLKQQAIGCRIFAKVGLEHTYSLW